MFNLFIELFPLAYVVFFAAAIIFFLRLLWRFVMAHERVAGALEIIARGSGKHSEH